MYIITLNIFGKDLETSISIRISYRDGIHNVFYVCYIRKRLSDKVDFLSPEGIWVDENKQLVEELNDIMDLKLKN